MSEEVKTKTEKRKRQVNLHRGRQINLRLSEQEYMEVRKASVAARQSVSEWVRERCLISFVIARVGR